MRKTLLSAIVLCACAAMLWAQPVSQPASSPLLTYVTTAHQLGVVGYRDPAGAISPDGKRFAYSEGRFIRVIPIGGGAPVTLAAGDGQVRALEWTSNDTVVAVPRPAASTRMPNGVQACLADRRLVIPCGGEKQTLDPNVDVFGPIAFTSNHVYFASPADNGMVALWSADLRTKRAQRVSNFSRDAYAPSAAADGTVVFKVQSYRTTLADVPAAGGTTRQLTTFQSETPSYHPTSPLIAFTYGTWRRMIDDAKYPDIAQEIGVINVSQSIPAGRPSDVIAQSESEDQAMAWSPNGKWIAFHTHREMSDDVWLRPVDGKQPDKRITFLGRGAEVGWPRWSSDGRNVLLNGARKRDGASVLYTIGVNQETGTVTSELKEIPVEGVTGEMGHAEWLPDSASIVAIAKEAAGRHVIFTVAASGGHASIVQRVSTEHDFSGLGVSPDGREVAFVAPAPDGYFQIFRKAIVGEAAARQVTNDPSQKTQPAWSPDGQRIAFTVWSYHATFYSFNRPPEAGNGDAPYFAATNMISTRPSGPTRPVLTVARAGKSLPIAAR